MAVPSTLPVKLSDIATEFGASSPYGLTDFYAGGTYVPSGTTNGSGTAIPSSGAISITDFLGASSASVIDISISSFSDFCSAFGGCSVTASVTFNTDGSISGDTTGTWSSASPNETGANYEIKATTVSGYPLAGTLNTWLSLSSARTWYKSASGNLTLSGVVNISIRRASDGVVLTSKDINWTVSAVDINL